MKKIHYPHYVKHDDGSLLIYVLYELPHLEYNMQYTELIEQGGKLDEGFLVYVYKISEHILEYVCENEDLYGLYKYIKQEIPFEELPTDVQVLFRLN